jgi:hypothetical protein
MTLPEMQQELRQKALAFAQTVAPFYGQLHWTWMSKEDEECEYTPAVADIVAKLLDLIDRLTPGLVAVSCGGLEVYYDDDRDGLYGLRFIYSVDCSQNDDDTKTDDTGNIFVTRRAN